MKIFARDCRGNATIEFAFVAPLLILTMLAVVEFALNVFIASTLEAAMLESSRYGVTGARPADVSREDQVRHVVSEWTYGLVDMDEVDFTTLIYQNFGDIGQAEPFADDNADGIRQSDESFTDVNGNGQWDPDMGAAGLGGPGDIVVYRINYAWGFVTPMLEAMFGDITHSSAVAVRNEPF